MLCRWAAALTITIALGMALADAQTDLQREKARESSQRVPDIVATPHGESPLTPLRFLLGDWEAIDGSPDERGGFTFALGVQGRVMVRSNFAEYAARPGRPASRHDDLMIVFVEGDRLHAVYVDSEQHVIRYVVESPTDREVLFISERKPSEPQYRLTYTANADGTLAGRFEIAAPGAADAFKPYLSWTARKRQ